MADISEVDVFEAFRSQWATSGVLVGWIPPGRVFHTTVWEEGSQYPICVVTMSGTNQMLVDPYCLKRYTVKLELRFKREEKPRSLIMKEILRLFTCSDDSPTSGLVVGDATVLHCFSTSSITEPMPKESKPGGPLLPPDNEKLQYMSVVFDVLLKVTRDT